MLFAAYGEAATRLNAYFTRLLSKFEIHCAQLNIRRAVPGTRTSHNFSAFLRSSTTCSTPQRRVASWLGLPTLASDGCIHLPAQLRRPRCRRGIPRAMSDGGLVFRTVYVDADVDSALLAQAARDGISKGRMFRHYLEVGMALAAKGTQRPTLPDSAAIRLRMRTVYLHFAVDEALAARSWQLKVSKSYLTRQYLAMGMKDLNR